MGFLSGMSGSGGLNDPGFAGFGSAIFGARALTAAVRRRLPSQAQGAAKAAARRAMLNIPQYRPFAGRDSFARGRAMMLGLGAADDGIPPAGETYTDAQGVMHFPADVVTLPGKPAAAGGLPTWAKVGAGLAIAAGVGAFMLKGKRK